MKLTTPISELRAMASVAKRHWIDWRMKNTRSNLAIVRFVPPVIAGQYFVFGNKDIISVEPEGIALAAGTLYAARTEGGERIVFAGNDPWFSHSYRYLDGTPGGVPCLNGRALGSDYLNKHPANFVLGIAGHGKEVLVGDSIAGGRGDRFEGDGGLLLLCDQRVVPRFAMVIARSTSDSDPQEIGERLTESELRPDDLIASLAEVCGNERGRIRPHRGYLPRSAGVAGAGRFVEA